jgi:hypothetical protein
MDMSHRKRLQSIPKCAKSWRVLFRSHDTRAHIEPKSFQRRRRGENFFTPEPALITRRLIALPLIVALVTPAAADDDNAPYSSVSTLPSLCGGPTDSGPIKGDLCKNAGYDSLAVAAQLDKAIEAGTAKAPTT